MPLKNVKEKDKIAEVKTNVRVGSNAAIVQENVLIRMVNVFQLLKNVKEKDKIAEVKTNVRVGLNAAIVQKNVLIRMMNVFQKLIRNYFL